MKIVVPAGSGSGGGDSFTTVQPITGTSPVADSSSDTITMTSSNGSVGCAGTAGTDTLDWSAKTLKTVTFVLALGVDITTGTNKTNRIPVPRAGTIVKTYAYAETAPTGADLIFDINKNGTSIWNATQANRLKIVAASNTGSQTSFDTTALAADDVLTIDVDQVGSTVPGQTVTVVLTYGSDYA